MRLLRGLAGAVLWILAGVLGLVGILLCVTIVLLPVGWVLLGYAGRLFAAAGRLMLPRVVSHPVRTLQERAEAAKPDVKQAGRNTRKRTKRMRKRLAA